jgi:peptide/nickel transport system permease protein
MSATAFDDRFLRRSGKLWTNRYVRRSFRNKTAIVGAAVLAIIVLAAILAPFLTPYGPNQMDLLAVTEPPSPDHWLGTDQLGKDVLTTLLYGARTSLYIGFISALGGTIIGVTIGAVTGYFGGWLDNLAIRMSELIMTFPELILVMILVTLIGQGVGNIILVFIFTGWMTTFRIVRTEFLSIRQETFIESGRSLGLPTGSLIFRHMLPNVMSPIVVSFTVNFALYIIAEAGLSFLGLGVPATTPTWGNMLSAAQSLDVVRNFWWLWSAPGTAIVVLVIAANLVGDALRDIMDPRGKS